MAISNTSERMIQIGERGNLWVAPSIARKYGLSPTINEQGELVPNPPIPSFIPGSEIRISAEMFKPESSGLTVEIDFLKSAKSVVRGIRNLIPPSPQEVWVSLRKVVANGSFIL